MITRDCLLFTLFNQRAMSFVPDTPPSRHRHSQSALRKEAVLCPICKENDHSHVAADASDLFNGWFHPSAVDAVTSWCGTHVEELKEIGVPPINDQELRL
jgi:hypothetical protein